MAEGLITVKLPPSVWQTVVDTLGGLAEQLEEVPGLGECRDCDQAGLDKCADHKADAEEGEQLRGVRDQIAAQLDDPGNANIPALVERTGLPLDSDIRDVLDGLSTRTMNALLRDDIRTLADLARRDDNDLLDIRWFGVVGLSELRDCLSQMVRR